MSESNNFGSFFLGFLSGAIVGAAATILYAPTSGEEARATINTKKDEFMDKANISVDGAYKHAESAARVAKDRFENIAAATREHAEEASRKGHVILEKKIRDFSKMTSEAEEVVETPISPDPEESDEILMPAEE